VKNPALTRYRIMATIVGLLLVVLILIGVPLANFDGSGMWGFIPATPDLFAAGSSAQELGESITTYLGVAHGWLYMIFLVTAFLLARQERWEIGFTVVTLVCGTIPLLSFWAEHRATQRVRADTAADLAAEAEAETARSRDISQG
jgi:integral membrane protein